MRGPMTAPTPSQITAFLASQSLPTAHPSFLGSIIDRCSRSQPLPALAATVKHRLLCSDISCSSSPILSPTAPHLPPDIGSMRLESMTLAQDVFVQILDIQDIGRSRWDELIALESERKGETKKGREIIRVVPSTEQEPSSAATQPIGAHPSKTKRERGPFKLILQDWKGGKAWGFELRRIDHFEYPPAMNIGCKLWLKKGCKVARGMLLLEPATVDVLGGKIEAIDKAWREKREDRLREALTDSQVGGTASA